MSIYGRFPLYKKCLLCSFGNWGIFQCSSSEGQVILSVGAGSGPGGTGSGSLEVPGFGSGGTGGALGRGLGFDFLAGGKLRLSCSKSEQKLAFFLSLLDLLGASPLPPPFPLFPITNAKYIAKMLFGKPLFGKCFSKWLLVYFWRENLPPLEEFHLDLHGSGKFFFD